MVARLIEIIGKWRSATLSEEDDKRIDGILSNAVRDDLLPRAPAHMAERIVAAALTESAAPAAESFQPNDLVWFLLRPRIVGASVASFAAGAALAVFLMDMKANVLVTSLMWGLALSVTRGGYV